MRVLGFALLAFVVTFVAVVAGTLTYWHYAGIQDQDGGGAMGVFFVIAPIISTVVAVIAAIATSIWLKRRNAAIAAGAIAAPAPWPLGVRRIIAAAASATAVYAAFVFAYWLAEPMTFDSYTTALIMAWLPTVAALSAATIGAAIQR